MKKKIITVILLAAMTCGMAACGQKEETSLNTEKEDTTVENNVPGEAEQKEEQEKKKDTDEEWGYQLGYSGMKNKDGENVRFNINFPHVTDDFRREAIMVKQSGNSYMVVLGDVDWEKNQPESLETVLESYDMSLDIATTRGIRGLDLWWSLESCTDASVNSADLKALSFDTESKELTTVNGFPMCKYLGNFVVECTDYTYTFPFAGYTADMQVGEGAWVTWLVVDFGEYSRWRDSVGTVFLEEGEMEEIALKMAESLKLYER